MKIHEYQATELFRNAGLPVLEGAVATDVNEALRIAQKIGFPVVLKAQVFGQELSSSPSAHAQSLTALDFVLGHSREIVLAGQKDDPQTQAMLKSLYGRFIPNKVVILRPASDEEAKEIISLVPFIENQRPLSGQTTAYVCKNYHCEFPASDIKKFEELFNNAR